MYTYITEVIAIDPKDGELKTWAGPNITAFTTRDAERMCKEQGLGFCRVLGRLKEERDTVTGVVTNYDQFHLN